MAIGLLSPAGRIARPALLPAGHLSGTNPVTSSPPLPSASQQSPASRLIPFIHPPLSSQQKISPPSPSPASPAIRASPALPPRTSISARTSTRNANIRLPSSGCIRQESGNPARSLPPPPADAGVHARGNPVSTSPPFPQRGYAPPSPLTQASPPRTTSATASLPAPSYASTISHRIIADGNQPPHALPPFPPAPRQQISCPSLPPSPSTARRSKQGAPSPPAFPSIVPSPSIPLASSIIVWTLAGKQASSRPPSGSASGAAAQRTPPRQHRILSGIRASGKRAGFPSLPASVPSPASPAHLGINARAIPASPPHYAMAGWKHHLPPPAGRHRASRARQSSLPSRPPRAEPSAHRQSQSPRTRASRPPPAPEHHLSVQRIDAGFSSARTPSPRAPLGDQTTGFFWANKKKGGRLA